VSLSTLTEFIWSPLLAWIFLGEVPSLNTLPGDLVLMAVLFIEIFLSSNDVDSAYYSPTLPPLAGADKLEVVGDENTQLLENVSA